MGPMRCVEPLDSTTLSLVVPEKRDHPHSLSYPKDLLISFFGNFRPSGSVYRQITENPILRARRDGPRLEAPIHLIVASKKPI
jgi:hypothetical protein